MMRATLALWAAWFLYWFWAGRKVRGAKASEGAPSRGAHLAVLAAGFLALFSDVLRFGLLGRRLWSESAAVSAAGALLTAAGLLFCVWARAHLGLFWSGEVRVAEGHRLIKSGPYAYVRHPIYTGFLLAIIGSALTLGEVRGIVIIAATAAAYWRKIRLEERALGREFGGQYAAYRAGTKALIPFLF